MTVNKKMPHIAVIAVGSNHNAEENVKRAVQMMQNKFNVLWTSRLLDTEPIGMPLNTHTFANMIVVCTCNSNVDNLTSALKNMERLCGDTPQRRKYGIVSIDLDLLMYDGTKFHIPDWDRWYIKQLTDELPI